MDWYSKGLKEIEKELNTNFEKGLNKEEAEKRLEEYGENKISHEGKKKESLLGFLLN